MTYYEKNKDKIKNRAKEYYQNNKEGILAYQKKYKLNNKDKQDAYSKAYREKYKVKYNEYCRTWQLNNRYGLSQEKYSEMYMSQLGLCAICHAPFGNQKPCVDHCHKTGKIRGLAHSKCNLLLGIVEANLDKLDCVLDYLRK